MNFWLIFLCLLIGAVIGFEFGRYTVASKVKALIGTLADEMKKAAEDLKKTPKPAGPFQNLMERIGVTGFDTRYYKVPEGKDIPEGFDRKAEMDAVSRLIETMARNGAMDSELGRVVRYSMVVIDAEKLKLDWKQARKDEGIDILCSKYMTKELGNNEGN